MKITWHGTASIELECEKGRILFDPFIPLRGSETQINEEVFNDFTDIFITHGHFDHISSVPEILRSNPETVVHCTRTPYRSLLKKGVASGNLKLISFGQTLTVNGFKISIMHGKHAVLPKASLKRLLYMFGSPNRKNICHIVRENAACPEHDETVFYQIEADGLMISLMGSMNLREDVSYPEGADILILPYNGWEDNYTPAVRVTERLRPKHVLLDHYDDTFPPVTMPLDISFLLEQFNGKVSPLAPGRPVDTGFLSGT